MPTPQYTIGDAPPSNAKYTIGDAPEDDSFLTNPAHAIGQFGIGALKGAGSTANRIGHLLVPDWAVRAVGATPPTEAQQESYFKPQNNAQEIGKATEQTGEFLAPGLGEESVTSHLPEFLEPAARFGYNALTSGAVNKAQGGSFGTGAAVGGVGNLAGEGLRAAAPKLAESAIGITKADRGFGKNPGRAILDETRGIRPETIERSAQGKLDLLGPQLEQAAAQSANPADLTHARRVVGQAINKATSRNAASTVGQMEPMYRHLSTRFDTGAPIPVTVTPKELLDLRRGFNEEFGHWNPETLPGVSGTGRQAYHALTNEFHHAVPGTEEIDQRISNLIPVARRAESTSRNAPLIQRVGGRFAAHTGALTGAALGAAEGRREGGLGGMLTGGTIGLLAPELIATPEGRMVAARMMNHPNAPIRLLGGAGLQFDREDEEK